MSDLKALLERADRAVADVPLSAGGFIGLQRRRDRKRRNQRITAGVVGIAVFVAAVWIVTSGVPAERTQTPSDEPSTVRPTDPAEDIVRGFITAFRAFDPETAMTYVAEDADLRGLIDPPTPANGRGLSLMLALFEAVGYQQEITWCRADPFESGTSVVCAFDFTTIHAVELGRGWFTGSTFVFTVRDGEIVKAALTTANFLQYASQVRAPFAEWLAATHPRDFEVMYGSIPSRPAGFKRVRYRLTEESIRLFGLRTREYVEAVQQGIA
jgi:SnoaL-like domain